MLNELVRKAELGQAGIRDHFEEHCKRPLADHLTAWEEVLRARRNTGPYVDLKITRTRKIIDLLRVQVYRRSVGFPRRGSGGRTP